MTMINISDILCCGSRRQRGVAVSSTCSEKASLLGNKYNTLTSPHEITTTERAAIERIYHSLMMTPGNPALRSPTYHSMQQDIAICGGWTEWLARAIYDRIVSLVQYPNNRGIVGEAFARAWDEASEQAKNIKDWVQDHPLLTAAMVSVIVLGILMLTCPWVLEVLGFGELGPVAGMYLFAFRLSRLELILFARILRCLVAGHL